MIHQNNHYSLLKMLQNGLNIVMQSMMLNKVDDNEKQLIQIGTLNNVYSAWFLTEDGLYEVFM